MNSSVLILMLGSSVLSLHCLECRHFGRVFTRLLVSSGVFYERAVLRGCYRSGRRFTLILVRYYVFIDKARNLKKEDFA